jgi:hypothetical protein
MTQVCMYEQCQSQNRQPIISKEIQLQSNACFIVSAVREQGCDKSLEGIAKALCKL